MGRFNCSIGEISVIREVVSTFEGPLEGLLTCSLPLWKGLFCLTNANRSLSSGFGNGISLTANLFVTGVSRAIPFPNSLQVVVVLLVKSVRDIAP